MPKIQNQAPPVRAATKQPRTLTNCVRTLRTGGHVKLTPVHTLGIGHAVGGVRIHIHYGVKDLVPTIDNVQLERICGFLAFAALVFLRMRGLCGSVRPHLSHTTRSGSINVKQEEVKMENNTETLPSASFVRRLRR